MYCLFMFPLLSHIKCHISVNEMSNIRIYKGILRYCNALILVEIDYMFFINQLLCFQSSL